MVGNLIQRKTDNTFLQLYFLFFCVLGWRPLFVFFYNCIVCFSVHDVADHCLVANLIHKKTENTIVKKTNNGWQPNTQKNRQYNYK
jgi:hypothetical protein